MKVQKSMAKEPLRHSSIVFVLSLLMFLITGCEKLSYEEEFLDFPRIINLDGTSLPQSKNINQVFYMMIINNYLVVSDPKEGFLFSAINLSSTDSVFHFGEVGDGPCEFQFPTSIQPLSAKDQTLGLYSRSTWTYQKAQFVTSKGQFKFDCIDSPSKPFDPNYQKIVSISDSLFLGVGIFPFKYALSHLNSAVSSYLNIPYPFVQEEYQNGEIAMSQQGELFKSPNGQKIIVTSKYSPFYDILEYDLDNFSILKRMEGWKPERLPNEQGNTIGANLTNSNRFGFISATVSKNFIYLLFSGKTFDSDPFKSNIVLKYNWEGDKIEKLKLDHEVSYIAVDEEDNFLISYFDNGEPNLVKFVLN